MLQGNFVNKILRELRSHCTRRKCRMVTRSPITVCWQAKTSWEENRSEPRIPREICLVLLCSSTTAVLFRVFSILCLQYSDHFISHCNTGLLYMLTRLCGRSEELCQELRLSRLFNGNLADTADTAFLLRLFCNILPLQHTPLPRNCTQTTLVVLTCTDTWHTDTVDTSSLWILLFHASLRGWTLLVRRGTSTSWIAFIASQITGLSLQRSVHPVARGLPVPFLEDAFLSFLRLCDSGLRLICTEFCRVCTKENRETDLTYSPPLGSAMRTSLYFGTEKLTEFVSLRVLTMFKCASTIFN